MPVHSLLSGGPLRFALPFEPGDRISSCARSFRPTTRFIVSLLTFRYPSALRSSWVSPSIFTTMASADFSSALTPEISPGKVHELSTRAARLYRSRLSVTLGLSDCRFARYAFPSTLIARETASLPVRVPAAVPLPPPSFVLSPSRGPPWSWLRLSSLFPNISFHLFSSRPCRAH